MKKIKPCYFIQDWGTYNDQTLVCVGMTKKEIKKAIARIPNAEPGVKEWGAKVTDEFLYDRGNAFCHDPETGATILSLKQWDGSVHDMGVLVHELNHAIYRRITQEKEMEDETEAQAYQQEYLFTQIARKLNKRLSLHKSN